MQTIRPIPTDYTIDLIAFKINPMEAVEQGEGLPVAVLHRNQPVFYCVPADAYEAMMDKLEDVELTSLFEERQNQPEIEINKNDL
jgi:antitoxin StbD